MRGSLNREEIKHINFIYDVEKDDFVLVIDTNEKFLKKFSNKLNKKPKKTTLIGTSEFDILEFSSSSVVLTD